MSPVTCHNEANRVTSAALDRTMRLTRGDPTTSSRAASGWVSKVTDWPGRAASAYAAADAEPVSAPRPGTAVVDAGSPPGGVMRTRGRPCCIGTAWTSAAGPFTPG